MLSLEGVRVPLTVVTLKEKALVGEDAMHGVAVLLRDA